MPKPQTRLVLPPVWQRPLEMREAREHGPCSLRELRENFVRAQPALGLSRTKGRELGQHWPRRGRSPGSRGAGAGDVSREASGQTNLLPSPLDPPLNTF